MPYTFNASAQPTVGVEIELQLIDAETQSLRNAIGGFLERVPEKWSPFFKPEFMQSYCEINTDVCETVGDVERDLVGKLTWAADEAAQMGLRFVWGG